MTELLEKIDNLILLTNGLVHINYELNIDNPLFFRIGKESHLVFYRSMVEALRGSANLSITGKTKDIKRLIKYKIGDDPWLQIEKKNIDKCKHAWRYSNPIPTREPTIMKDPFDINDISDYLQSFYELLAKIQAECFMSHYVHSKPIQVSIDEMILLEWLHEKIRNEFEHFIPKYYSVSIPDLIDSSILCMKLSYKLLFESGNVIFHTDNGLIKLILDKNIKILTKKKRNGLTLG